MRRVLMTALAATAAIALGTAPAQAATILNATCSGNCFTSPLVDNVNLTSATGVAIGDHGYGTVDGLNVTFTSSTNVMDLANGAATISADGRGATFGDISFALDPGVGFTYADFSLDQASKPITLLFTLSDGTSQSVTISKPTGSEPFGIQADAGTYINSVDLVTTAGTFNTFKQLKLGGFNRAVPEPATWAMMLLGFGGIGVAMRRRRKPALMQVA